MARQVFTVPTWSCVAVGDGINMVDSQHVSIKGGSTTQRVNIMEVYTGGLATASAPIILQLARHSTVGATLTALAGPNSDEPMDPATAALAAPVLPYVASTTKPQADANAKLGSYAFNAFGGLVRKQWNPGEGPSILGNTASFGELGLNGYTGTTTGTVGSHIEYEPL